MEIDGLAAERGAMGLGSCCVACTWPINSSISRCDDYCCGGGISVLELAPSENFLEISAVCRSLSAGYGLIRLAMDGGQIPTYHPLYYLDATISC